MGSRGRSALSALVLGSVASLFSVPGAATNTVLVQQHAARHA